MSPASADSLNHLAQPAPRVPDTNPDTKSGADTPLADVELMSARMLYAQQLAELRARSGLSLAALSQQCRYEQSYLHRLETGSRLGTVEAAAALDRFYCTGTLLVGLWRLAKHEAKHRPFFGLPPLEADAASIQEYTLTAVPELLQTPAYAEERLGSAGLHTPEQLSAQIDALLRRQARLTSNPPIHYRAVLDEYLLHRKARNASTWADQLDHLIALGNRPGVSLQILPAGTGPHLLHGPLELITLSDGRTLAYAHSSWSGHLINDPADVQPLRQTYDLLRDTALSPAESVAQLRTLRTAHSRHTTATTANRATVTTGGVP